MATATLTTRPDVSNEIVVTEKAIREIERIRSENNIPTHHKLRLGVKGGGCSGLSYVLAFDEAERPGDRLFDFGSTSVIVDPKSLFYLSGTTLEFNDGLNARGFVFKNPNAQRTCGCGESFAV